MRSVVIQQPCFTCGCIGKSGEEIDDEHVQLEVVGRVINFLTNDQRRNLYIGTTDKFSI
jgi:hypothetical protein